jgi:hypothetical protein
MLLRHRDRQNNPSPSGVPAPTAAPPVPGRPSVVPAQRSLDEQQRVVRWVGRCQDQP